MNKIIKLSTNKYLIVSLLIVFNFLVFILKKDEDMNTPYIILILVFLLISAISREMSYKNLENTKGNMGKYLLKQYVISAIIGIILILLLKKIINTALFVWILIIEVQFILTLLNIMKKRQS